MLDLKKEMIIIDDEIATKKIAYCKWDTTRNLYLIKYIKSSRFYHFPKTRLKVLLNPKSLDTSHHKFYVKNQLLKNIKEIYEFESDDRYYYHVIFNNSENDYSDNELKKLNLVCYRVIAYMNEVSQNISVVDETGKKILPKQMKKIEIDSLDTALANYLQISSNLTKKTNIETLIFPFGCNSSQYEAVENAIYHKISVVEGPPGTGKTQTILNIIANIIVRNMNCQVVSNNNSATVNIADKLKHYDLDFFVALLGRSKNKDLFIEEQKEEIPDFSSYENVDIYETEMILKHNNQMVRKFYDTKKQLARLIQKKNELELEYRYFQELIKSEKVELVELKRCNFTQLKRLWNEIMIMDELSIWHKLKYIYLYKIGDFKFYRHDQNMILKTLQNQIYLSDLSDLASQIREKEEFIQDHEKIESDFIQSSMDYFKKYLSIKYKKKRKKYSSSEIWQNCEEFLADYPVILSTTYSSRNTFREEFKLDYIIMDESSQIDVVTGTLALSSAKYAVVIGDEKQLPNVIPRDIKEKTSQIAESYQIDKCYSYSLNSFLSSVKNAIPNVPNKMLVEHYRCHPKIINFCNKKFYNNQLVIMTEDKEENNVIRIIKTKKGNHKRDLASQRQVDEIKAILSKINTDDVGVIAPYNNQVELIRANTNNLEVSTVHKFQGREKDVIIISTVDDDISDFVGNANILNVAISRAKKQLFFIVTGNEIKNTNIRDFIDYVDYNNMAIVNSKIYSSFDLLYKQYELERLIFFKKHNRISKYDSENIIYYVIKEIIDNSDHLKFHFHQSLNDLIKDKSLLNEEEKRYASHHNTHLDFYIFKEIGEKPILAIEVDGYKNHKEGGKQYERDLLKNRILEKYKVPLLRLKTNESEEVRRIKEKIAEIQKGEYSGES